MLLENKRVPDKFLKKQKILQKFRERNHKTFFILCLVNNGTNWSVNKLFYFNNKIIKVYKYNIYIMLRAI